MEPNYTTWLWGIEVGTKKIKGINNNTIS
jgi:hypothetical protein